MKKRYILLVFFLIAGLIVNSCKKSDQTPIATLFTGGTWKLASVEVRKYVGNTGISDTTMSDTCDQYLTFNTDQTCTYANFHCIAQPVAKGAWSLTPNQLYLTSDMVCKDTTATGVSQPFINAQIQTLGQFSLVLNTGDIEPNFSLSKPRTIVVYGFVRQKTISTDQ